MLMAQLDMHVTPGLRFFFLPGARFFSQPIYHMAESQKRVVSDHARTGITHYLLYLLPHYGLIAVDLAVPACCLVLLKRALSEPHSRILNKLLTCTAKLPFCLVVFPTIDSNHVLNSPLLSLHAGMHDGLGSHITAPAKRHIGETVLTYHALSGF